MWCVYNHSPGGQLVAQKFDTYKRKKKTGADTSEDIVFTAESQIAGFMKSEFVTLKMKGKELQKHAMLTFPENVPILGDPAPQVLKWALEQGAEPYHSPQEVAQRAAKEGRPVADTEQQKQIDALKSDVAGLKAGQDKILEALTALKPVAAPTTNKN